MELTVAYITRAFIVILSIIRPIYNAPRTPSAKYDQKQSGDVNVHVHLKDFNVIAVLGDNTWTGNGDYDYNYDYSDLTIKPSPPLTTEVAQNSSELSTEASSTLPTTKSSDPSATIPVIVISENPQPISNSQKAQEGEKDGKTTTSKVGMEPSSKKPDSSVTNVSIIPDNKEINRNEQHLPLGEIMHYRKCAEGFTRDKHGRCRKVRRTSHLPFGITRFATNLAARFKQATIGNRETRVE